MQFESESYREVVTKLDSACEWLASVGIRYSPTRLGLYRKLVLRVTRLYEAGKFAALQQTDLNAFSNAWSECAEIIDVVDALRSHACKALVERLRQALRGHELYTSDNDDRSGRDIMFELAVAARLARNGCEVDFSGEADVEFEFEHFSVFIECKRPRFDETVVENVEKARAQLLRRYAASRDPTTARGFIAISMTKIVRNILRTALRGMPSGDGPEEVSNFASRIVNAFVEDKRRAWQCESDTRTLGAIVALDFPAIIRKPSPMLVIIRQLGVSNVLPPDDTEVDLLHRVAFKLDRVDPMLAKR